MLAQLKYVSSAPFSTAHRTGFKNNFQYPLKMDDYCWRIYTNKKGNHVQEVPIWHLHCLPSFCTRETKYNYNFWEACKVSWYWSTIDGPHCPKTLMPSENTALTGSKEEASNSGRQQQSRKTEFWAEITFIFLFNTPK